MGNSERLSSPAANAAFALEAALTQRFRTTDGVIDFEERRILKLSRALTRETDRLDNQLAVIACAFRADGIGGTQFERKLREYHRDFDPEPPNGGGQKKEAA